MAYTTIDNPELYFQIVTYTGDGNTGRSITLPGDTDMQPDLVWLKSRGEAEHHQLTDSVRGVNKQLYSHLAYSEATETDRITAFNSDGFTIEDDIIVNKDTVAFVAWCWKAGTAFSNDASATSVGNTDSSGSASSTAGFSISKYVGAGSSLDIQVKHGLSVKPAVMFTKNIEEAGGNSWAVYHHKNTSAPETDYLKLDTTDATTDHDEIWLDTEPTSAVFTAGDHSGSNRLDDDFISYFWNEVQGYSKFSSFVGNGSSTDGTFCFCGFKPSFVMVKRTDAEEGYGMFDTKRDTYNPVMKRIEANDNAVERTDLIWYDFYSNGFKARQSYDLVNADGGTYIYMAFAEAPFVNSNGVPCNAR
jgi:hypothetical protein